MTDAANKCPYVVRKGTQDGQPVGICKFDKAHGFMCPLLTSEDIEDDDITCFDLPDNLLRTINKYPNNRNR